MASDAAGPAAAARPRAAASGFVDSRRGFFVAAAATTSSKQLDGVVDFRSRGISRRFGSEIITCFFGPGISYGTLMYLALNYTGILVLGKV